MGAMRRISASSRLLVSPAAKTLRSLDTSPGPVVPSELLLANARGAADCFFRLIRSLLFTLAGSARIAERTKMGFQALQEDFKLRRLSYQ
jgi:hypothetical protein